MPLNQNDILVGTVVVLVLKEVVNIVKTVAEKRNGGGVTAYLSRLVDMAQRQEVQLALIAACIKNTRCPFEHQSRGSYERLEHHSGDN